MSIINSVFIVIFISIVEFIWFSSLFLAVAKTDFLSLLTSRNVLSVNISSHSLSEMLYGHISVALRRSWRDLVYLPEYIQCMHLIQFLHQVYKAFVNSGLLILNFFSVDILSIYSFKWYNSLCRLLHIWKYCSSVKVWFLIPVIIEIVCIILQKYLNYKYNL